MGASANATKLTDLLDPQVIADFIDKKLVDAIRLAPLATVDNTLVGRPGDELTFPAYTYVGDAEDVAEGSDIPIAKLTQTEAKVKVSKVGRAIEFTDEALISGAGNVADEASSQVLKAINSKVEKDLLSNMAANATLVSTPTSGTDIDDAIADALTLFGEDIDGDKVIVLPPAKYGELRKSGSWVPNTEIGAEILVRGTVGMVQGCQIITSNRLYDYAYAVTSDSSMSSSKTYYEKVNNTYVETEDSSFQSGKTYYEKSSAKQNTAYIIKPGALRLVMKRDTLVEFDRDIISETNYIKASKLVAPYVYDASKLIKINLGA